jgi:hypothetical protein
VRDEYQCEPEPLLKVCQEIKDGCLNRHVERRNWLVGHKELRFNGKSAGYGNPLPLPTGEFAWIGTRKCGVEPNLFKQLADPCSSSLSKAQAVEVDQLAEDRTDLQARVK